MLREEGTLAMFKGLLPRLLYVAPFGAVQVFCLYLYISFANLAMFKGLFPRLLYVALFGAVHVFLFLARCVSVSCVSEVPVGGVGVEMQYV